MCFTFIAALFRDAGRGLRHHQCRRPVYGFGGSQWTREYALAPIRYAVAVGAKLFVLTLIVGLIMQVSAEWSAAYTNDEASLMTLVGLSLVCAYLTKTIPELIGGMISGTSMGGGSAIGGMAAAGAAGAAAAALPSWGGAAALLLLGCGGAGGLGGGGLAAWRPAPAWQAAVPQGASVVRRASSGIGASTGGQRRPKRRRFSRGRWRRVRIGGRAAAHP
jgi:type IV secretion system protein TrbL